MKSAVVAFESGPVGQRLREYLGSIQVEERPLPTLALACQEKENFSPRRSLEPITRWMWARARSSNPISIAALL